MTKINDFQTTLYYLGKVCKNNHVFAETNNSLRQKSNRTCVECQKQITQKYRFGNYELCNDRTKNWRKRIVNKKTKTCPIQKLCCVCEQLKSVGEFYSAKYSADGTMGHCKECDKQRQKARRQKYPKLTRIPTPIEVVLENRRIVKRRYKNSIKGKLANAIAIHRRKAILKTVESKNYTPTQLLARFEEFDNKCVYCGKFNKLTIDHFIPISKFGADKIENIVPACPKCNSSKNNKHPEKWFKSQPFFSNEKWEILLAKTYF